MGDPGSHSNAEEAWDNYPGHGDGSESQPQDDQDKSQLQDNQDNRNIQDKGERNVAIFATFVALLVAVVGCILGFCIRYLCK